MTGEQVMSEAMRRVLAASAALLCVALLPLGATEAQLPRAMRTVQISTRPADAPPPDSAYALPNNPYGAHLLVGDGAPGTRGHTHLRWARHLVGRWGYAKTFFTDIDHRTQGPQQGWIDYVNSCYRMELIPVIRLGGRWKDGQWEAPRADGPLRYRSMARAIRAVVEGLPRSDLCPLYIEIWNEPNLAIEWSGRPDPKEYAAFFVQAAEAVRSIGDPRIRVLNGALATSPEWTEALCRADPKFISSFDVWASHPYPHNHPPEINFHDRTVPAGSELAIDSYLLELKVLADLGRPDVKVMITETGYDLGNSTYAREGFPIIDEYLRADYIVRAFRDFWTRWPEVLAVLPFEFCNENWRPFDWVEPDSDTNPDGSPTRPHYQYTAVAALAKPTDLIGAVSGTIRAAGLDARIEKVDVSLRPSGTGGAGAAAQSDPLGNYFLSGLKPGTYELRFARRGFRSAARQVEVSAGRNTVIDPRLEVEARCTLEGTVRHSHDGKPLEGVAIRLEPGGLSARTDRGGRFRFTGCAPVGYRLIARLEGFHEYEVSGVEPAVGKATASDFVLGPRRAPDVENLLSNGGFEAGGGGGGKAGIGLSFEPLDPPPQQQREEWTSITERRVHSGRRAQVLHLDTENLAIRQITHYGTGRPGATYVAGAWVYGDMSDRRSAAWVALAFTRNDGSVIGLVEPRSRVEGRPGKWTWVSVEGRAPEGTHRVSVNLRTSGRGGAAFFDDVFLGVRGDKPPE